MGTSQRVALAKLTPPRLYAIMRRERLFTLLDEYYRHYPLIWVAGPPGSGKTSLIASYLAEHKQRTLWYHVDPGDADLSTFFHYLAQAAQAAAGRRKLRLPALTTEFMADVPGFTRRFMRELWAKVPLPATVVLDNYQDLPEGAALHTVLSIALEEFPPGATLAVISRGEAPSTFARERTHSIVGHIRWENLRLTLEETRTLASSVPDLDQSTVSSLHATTNGWMAGTILLLQRGKANETWNTPTPLETRTEVFHYFAEQVFMHMDVSARDVLMRTALLPWVTGPMAVEVSGQLAAAQIIRELYQRGLFVDRRADAEVHYQYHDLFREFLMDRCHAHFTEQQLQNIKGTVAKVAERSGQYDTAAALYAETQSWDELSRLICEMSERLISQGRYQTLQKYISLLPHVERQQRAWVVYWSGMGRLVFDPVTAQKDLEEAYRLFESNRDVTGLLLSCGGIIESYYYRRDDMAPTIAWGDRIHNILQQHNGFPSPAIEARVRTNLQGLILACPHHPLILELERSLEQVLHSLNDSAARVGVAISFMNLLVWRGEFLRLRQILDELTASSRNTPLPPVHHLTLTLMEGHCAWGTGHPDQAGAKFGDALRIVEKHGIHVFKTQVRACQAYSALVIGDDQDAERIADLLQEENQSRQRFSLGLYYFYRAGISLIRGDLPSAREFALSALHTTDSLSVPHFAANFREGMAKILIESGEIEKARDLLTTAIGYARAMRSHWGEVRCLMTLAHSYLREKQSHLVDEYLGEGLKVAQRHDHVVLDIWWRPKVMAELLAHALEADIEVKYVRSIIRRRGLRAPSSTLTRWPYPVSIVTLGRFEITIDDSLLTYTGKAQRKPLELLKYLCAAGAHGVYQDLIEETLWPEADGEASDQAFRTTLHRLRKLLRHDDAVQVSDHHISLDPSQVSLDHMAFERLARDIDRTDAAAIEQTLALYRGHFLHGETAPWVLPVREQLRAQFLTLTEQLGSLLEEKGKVGEATHRYLCALEVEPTAEVICRRVMMTYVQVGRRSEAIGVYQRFSQALHAKLGIPPTSETVSLYHHIAKT